MSVEKKVYFELLRVCLGNRDTRELSVLLKKCDMPALETMVARSGLDGFIHAALERKGACSLFGTDFLKQLQGRAGLTAIKNGEISRELVDLSRRFEAGAVRHVFLKGIQLVERTYADLSYRAVTDIDVLIEKECTDTAVRILEDMGYVYGEGWVRASLPEVNRERAERELYEIPFIKKAKPFDLLVDLHLGRIVFLPNNRMDDLFRVEGSRWLDSAVPVMIRGEKVLCPDNEMMLLNMICHDAFHHRFVGVKWIVDICCFVKKASCVMDWRKFEESVEHPHLKRTATLCLLLAENVAGENLIPPDVRTRLTGNRRHRLLVSAYRSMVFDFGRGIGHILREGLLMVSLAEGARDKFGLTRYLLFDREIVKNRAGEKGSRIPAFLLPFFKIWFKRGMQQAGDGDHGPAKKAAPYDGTPRS